MDDFLKQFKIRCKAEVSQYGFRQKKNVFVRLVNDVVQSFYVEKLCINSRRIGFSVLPICQRLEAKQVLGGFGVYYLRKFEISHWSEDDRWRYKSMPEDIDACVDEMLMYINKYLLPFFEQSDSCQTALPAIIALEKLFNDNRKEILRRNGMRDKAAPNAELNLSDSTKCFMALKNGDFDFALKSRQALLQQNVDSYNSMSEMGYLTEKDRLRREKCLAELRDEIDHLIAKDIGYFLRLIEENETYSIESLKGII